jgi:3D (Asp-Asp-Asp) domain-containing protein
MTGSHPPAAVRSPAASVLLLACALAFGCCAKVASGRNASVRVLTVTATAYNSVPEQTEGDPHVAAWGDVLVPGMRSVAVSSDLLERGLRRGATVRIAGLPGEWVVLDRMPSRWTRRIDLYMGRDVDAARAFGRREVQITWSGS